MHESFSGFPTKRQLTIARKYFHIPGNILYQRQSGGMNDLSLTRNGPLNTGKVSQSDQIEKRKTKVENKTIEYARYPDP
jgi:hypothetical protein